MLKASRGETRPGALARPAGACCNSETARSQITAFHPSHFMAIRPHELERSIVDRATPDYLFGLAAEPSATLWLHGRPMACAGVLGNCELWALIDREIAPHRFTLFRAARRFLARFGWLYANVAPEFAAGCRWLEHLGFDRIEIRSIEGRNVVRYELSDRNC